MSLLAINQLGFRTLSICLLILHILLITTARADHNHLHHRHHHDRRNQAQQLPNATNSDDYATMVKNALAVLAEVNKDRVQNPNFNQYAFEEPQPTKV
jgi:hypothetical protein